MSTLEKTEKQDRMVVVSPGRPAYPTRVYEAFGITQGDWKALVDAIYPTARTTDAIVLALTYCRARNLDIFKKQCHIVPIWDSKKKTEVETIWPGIAELRTTAVRTGEHAGFDEAQFGPEVTQVFSGEVRQQHTEKTVTFPLWCQITCYKLVKGQRVPFPGPKVRWLETYATMGASDVPNEMWATRPYGQLEKCAEAASLRRAFPEELGSDYIPEEVGRARQSVTIDVTTLPNGEKTSSLAAKLKKTAEERKVEDETGEGTPVDPGEDVQAGDDEGDQAGETLADSQVAELRALAGRNGVDIGTLEEMYGCPLEEIVVPGKSAKGVEAELIEEIRKLKTGKAAAGADQQLPLGKR